MNIEFSIWLASKTRWAHLVKTISLSIIPRTGEFMKFHNKTVGDYFAWEVTEVRYHESGNAEVWTELLNNIENRGYSFEDEEEFDEYFQSYLAEGWQCVRGIRSNPYYKADST